MASAINTTNIYNLWSTRGSEFVTAVVLLGAVALIGLCGNGIVVFIIASSRRRGQRSPVQLFLLHLAISDLLVCLLNIPLTIWVNFYYPEEDMAGASAVCKITRFVQFLAPSSSMCLLTVISVDRYFSLVRPFQAMKTWLRPRFLISFAWIYGIAIFLPTFYFADTVKVSSGDKTFWYCRTIPNNTAIGSAYLIFLSLFTFGIQLVVIIVLYSRVAKAVWSRERKISRHGTVSRTNAEALDKTRRRVTGMLLTVIICFLICWAPFVIYTGFIEKYVAPFPNPGDPVRVISYGFGIFNSTCNPFIYFFNSPNFRRDSLRKICLEAVAAPNEQNGIQRQKSEMNTNTSMLSRTNTTNNIGLQNRLAASRVNESAGFENGAFDTRL
ncbi:pyroglutamylated RF-amide peptide receptor-like [Acropora millepora]|uniref:pyroglutamylated RF-amide peptide receptor-like n=1 Tax=Acropora millepora TaxID=45264 RepID=UPI001CF16C54|nr:pyroglutamylated RF-amide peptide receptor-like [Acropora millepora]XP_029212603.2 pyroglutamylated RF-amide peptide receptor-like [Acropora millepora]XP_029212605.2 pyroglutamylated RF-amide peptide receptor-like [Acropora millepora]XP_029212606.2 pyroglutamylated RF-amide peptide receptor-like [Acropora millepora]